MPSYRNIRASFSRFVDYYFWRFQDAGVLVSVAALNMWLTRHVSLHRNPAIPIE